MARFILIIEDERDGKCRVDISPTPEGLDPLDERATAAEQIVIGITEGIEEVKR